MAEFTRPLRLVTPHMKGDRVKDAQYLMKGNNRFKGLATYKDGKVDGEYGPLTAQATKQTKFWVGYPKSSIDGNFGQTLYEYLRRKNWRPLPKAFQERREQRLAAVVKEEAPCLKAFAFAEKQIGYKEEPRRGVNDNKYGRWYGWNWVPWCAIFESYCFAHTGWPQFRFASVEAIYWAAVAHRFKLYIVRSPKKGDIIGYSLGGSEFAHTAFFDHWVSSSRFVDLGGNTGPTNISNGGMVMRQERPTSLVRYYARVAAT
jgi:hypothetical protein